MSAGALRQLAVDSLTSADRGLHATGANVQSAQDRYSAGVLAPLTAGLGWTGAGQGTAAADVAGIHARLGTISPVLFDSSAVVRRWAGELAEAQAKLGHLDQVAEEHGLTIQDDGTVHESVARAVRGDGDSEGAKEELQSRVSALLAWATDTDETCARALRALTHDLTADSVTAWLRDGIGEALEGLGEGLGAALRELGVALDAALDSLGTALDVILDDGVGLPTSLTVQYTGESVAIALESLGLVAAGRAVRTATKEAAEAVEEALDNAGRATRRALDRAGDATESALDRAGDAVENFLGDHGDHVDTDDTDEDGEPGDNDDPDDKDGEGNKEGDKNSEDAPDPEDIHLPEDRETHILAGDEKGGGHRSGTGKPNKTEFPPGWNDEKIVRVVNEVAQDPDAAPDSPQGNGNYKYVGERGGVEVVVIVAPDGEILTAYPTHGPGVVKNDKHGNPHPKP